ncbi:AMP-binding protein [Prauserella oleivorans]
MLGGATPPADLLATAHGAAAWLARQGVTEGSRIAVDSPDVLPWLLGADLLGAATLVTEPTWTHREREAVLQDAAPSLVVSGTPAPAGSVEPCGGDPHFYLPTTSGSSGRPKVGIRTRASWLRSFAALGHVRGPVLVAGPLSSSLFLFGALHTLWCAERLWLRPRWDPGEARHACAVHVVPAMLADLVADAERRPGSSALGTVVCGGAHVAPELRKRFARAFPGPGSWSTTALPSIRSSRYGATTARFARCPGWSSMSATAFCGCARRSPSAATCARACSIRRRSGRASETGWSCPNRTGSWCAAGARPSCPAAARSCPPKRSRRCCVRSPAWTTWW